MSKFARIFLVMAVWVTAAQFAAADSPNVTAVLSSSEAEVGETVDLEIRVNGERNADVPQEIAVDGLEIHRTGTSQQVEMHNFSVTSTVTYNYTILPTKSGTFRIPSQAVRVADKTLRTPELTLHVSDSGTHTTQTNPNMSRAAQRQSANGSSFAELIVPKKSAYVGEVVPVQIRLGFDPRAQPQFETDPEITGQGFTSEKLQLSGKRMETVDGKTYLVVSFKTAIAAAHSGKFEVGPVRVKAQVSVPRRPAQRRQRSPSDLFDLDPFNDPFFMNPFGQLAERRDIEVKSDAVPFEVKPLPPNQPPGFSGAVGNFTMISDAKPTTLQIGDPITITSTITGRGNFDRVNNPVLENEQGWHKYPASSKFNQDDDVGISGSKTFEMVVSPNEKKQKVPPLIFSYFDPAKEGYVTLRSDSVPINVEGGLPPVVSNPGPSATPLTAAVAQAKPADILYQLNDFGETRAFTPIYAQPVFWAAQIVPLLGLLGFVGWQLRQNKIDNRAARRIEALETETAALMRNLRRNDISPCQYYADASRAVRLKTALAKNVEPASVDLETAATAFQLDDDGRERLQKLFERSDELQYSGTANGVGKISHEDRQQVLELISRLRT